ncbi:alpha/beta hydrolase [Rhodococcus sp. BP-252]|nr:MULTISPECIES: lipase family protein [Rhodococcus]MBY6413785.1 alpha/beta hydrolase [Rhodococcus sp. BP-320]MBY6418434.1 alpha/beta hydrolase [Rhodococcus sp. BP-321]MBY6422559.1 alpha/beta hydrolase [Rhodococcus sp. BP-324]MBY6428424.1 alpha/beta hydrolase [Rhodococcus sp. BP-323]MBY6433601.1 alpha/beta hydrolase [Rhodococcus sp. BP-322]
MRLKLVAALSLSLLLAGCAATPSLFAVPGIAAFALRDRPSEPIEIAENGTGPGSIVSAETMPNLPWSVTRSGLNAARVVYRSVGDVEVSGSMFTPTGDAPDGGWPVISFGHGTTGIDEACGPSLSSDLLGVAPLVAGYTAAGFAVAITDYEGLGHPGVHPYLDNIAAGYNMIDAVRALGHVFPNVSSRWVAFGGSQGGGAAWAANEQAGYAPELEMLGSVSLAPGANMAGLVDKAQRGTLTADQAPLLQWVLESLSRKLPGLDLDLYRSGNVAADWDALSACTPDGASARSEAAKRIGPTDLAPKTEDAAGLLRYFLDEMSVPQQGATAPMLVVYGDADTYIDAVWTDEAVRRACALGDTVAIDRQPGKGHGDVDGTAVNHWIGERFADEPAVDDCK